MSDRLLDPAAVEIGRFLTHPPERVWQALTDPALMRQWLARPVGFVPEVGVHFVFDVRAEPTREIACEVLVADAPTRLRYTWVYPGSEFPTRWRVDFRLEAQGRGTRLLFTQTGFDVADHRQKMARNAMERGWKGAMVLLADLLDTEVPPTTGA